MSLFVYTFDFNQFSQANYTLYNLIGCLYPVSVGFFLVSFYQTVFTDPGFIAPKDQKNEFTRIQDNYEESADEEIQEEVEKKD
mmetsp:Transcript_11037/g.11127  ORF Transcript_11037/g.11127 Transcript_11037/m.11127 type:complete len:83 (+) Transcript_11037:82-330(+)